MKLGISEATFHRWKARYGGMNPQEAKRLRELEMDARLKKLLAEKELDLGHADITKTVNVYSHVLPDTQETAASAMDYALE